MQHFQLAVLLFVVAVYVYVYVPLWREGNTVAGIDDDRWQQDRKVQLNGEHGRQPLEDVKIILKLIMATVFPVLSQVTQIM